MGWVVVDGTRRSQPRRNYWSFWVDEKGGAHLGNLSEPRDGARWAVAGFGGLLEEGRILPGPSDSVAPRTGLGLDEGARHLILAVVDGRQKGYSEGVSTRELAQIMAELGCRHAINLDGGGSSVMVGLDAEGALQVLNRPSDPTGARPVPVMLGVEESDQP
jgi:hypothetical protein